MVVSTGNLGVVCWCREWKRSISVSWHGPFALREHLAAFQKKALVGGRTEGGTGQRTSWSRPWVSGGW